MFTRCPKCDTTFQLTETQLAARGGLVRCGRCRQVFNASWNLVDLPLSGEDSPQQGKPPPPADEAQISAGPAETSDESTQPEPPIRGEPREDWSWALPWEERDQATQAEAETDQDADSVPEKEPVDTDALAEELARQIEGTPDFPSVDPFSREPDEEIVLDSGNDDFDIPELEAPDIPPESVPPAGTEPRARETQPEPAGQGPRRSRRGGEKRAARRPAGRSRSGRKTKGGRTVLAWAAGSVALVLLILAQLLWFYFDELAQHPTTRGLIGWTCEWIGCSLPPRQEPERIELVGSRINYPPDSPGRLVIDAELVNRAEFEQPYPVLELTLTNRLGQVVARNHFAPRDYLRSESAANRMLPVRVAVPLHLVIASPADAVTGYEIRLLPQSAQAGSEPGGIKALLRESLK